MIWIQKQGPFLLINDLWPAKPSVELQMLSKTFFLLNLDVSGINTLTYIITVLKSKFCHSSQNLLNFANQNNSSALFFLITAQKHMKFFSFSQFSYQMQRVESKRVLYLCKLLREQLWQMKWGKTQPYCPLIIWKQTNKKRQGLEWQLFQNEF